MTPGDLTPPAQADLADVLKRSLAFGRRRSAHEGAADRPLQAHRGWRSHRASARRRSASGPHPLHHRGPLVIFYDAQTRLVLRIVDGRRDLAAVLRAL